MTTPRLAGSAARTAWFGVRLAAGIVVAGRLSRAARSAAPLHLDPSALPAGRATDGPVTVLVPARDEERRIGPLLAALARELTPHQLVVVDDESTDATAAVARAAGAQVVAGRPLPSGWVGKPWALQQGLTVATTTWVVTLDADTIPGRGLLAALVGRCEADSWDFLSVGARFRCAEGRLEGLLQQAVQASMLTTLVYRFGPPGAVHLAAAHRTMANGQCTVFRREALEAAGGFAAVAPHLTDDIALARHLARLGWRVGFLDGTGAIDVAMHENVTETWRDWGRSLPMPDVTAPRHQVADLAVVLLAQALPLVRLVTGRADGLDVVLLLLRVGTLVGTRRAFRRPGAGFWLSPLADGPVAARLVQRAVRPVRTWRGRHYRRSGV